MQHLFYGNYCNPIVVCI